MFHSSNSSIDLPPEMEINYFYVKSSGEVEKMESSSDCPNGELTCLLSSSGKSYEIYGGK